MDSRERLSEKASYEQRQLSITCQKYRIRRYSACSLWRRPMKAHTGPITMLAFGTQHVVLSICMNYARLLRYCEAADDMKGERGFGRELDGPRAVSVVPAFQGESQMHK